MNQIKKSETVLYNINGVKITAFIDYEAKTVSFVDEVGNPFDFTFADRTREYLGGWITIFRALEKITRDVDKKLKEQEDIDTEKFINTMIEWSEIKD